MFQFCSLRCLPAAIFTCCVIFAAHPAHALVSYSVPDSIYTQNFDSLPNGPENTTLGDSPIGWIDDTATPGPNQFSILGWYVYHPGTTADGGANGHQSFRISRGNHTTGAFMSYGLSGTTERALGNLGSNTQAATGAAIYMGVLLTNDTGETLDTFTISYHGEQWRDGGSGVAQGMTFGWSTTATAINAAPSLFNPVTELGFNSPVTGISGTAVDGNMAGRVDVGPITVTGVNWAPGANLWLRWTDLNHAGTDHGLAIDDVTFSASAMPEPSTATIIATGSIALVGRRRRFRRPVP